MRRSKILPVLLLMFCTAAPAMAQFLAGDAKGAKLGASQTQRRQVGVIITATGGPCKGIVGYVPLPGEWPEQQVKTVAEDISPGVKISYQTVDDSVQVMVVRVAFLPAGQEAKALVTLEIKRAVQLPPENKVIYQLPDAKKLDRVTRQYLGVSPGIESRNPKIRELAKQIVAGKETAWDKVEAIYDETRQKVVYKTGSGVQGAVASLKEGKGGHEDLTSLFIALCRAVDIPARTVWVPENCYPEFYLLDDKGEGHWFPCQAAGTRAFGEMPDAKPILQKGDNFRPPWKPRDHQRYLAEFLTESQSAASSKPRVNFVRKAVAN
jgi:hypothetical protein